MLLCFTVSTHIYINDLALLTIRLVWRLWSSFILHRLDNLRRIVQRKWYLLLVAQFLLWTKVVVLAWEHAFFGPIDPRAQSMVPIAHNQIIGRLLRCESTDRLHLSALTSWVTISKWIPHHYWLRFFLLNLHLHGLRLICWPISIVSLSSLLPENNGWLIIFWATCCRWHLASRWLSSSIRLSVLLGYFDSHCCIVCRLSRSTWSHLGDWLIDNFWLWSIKLAIVALHRSLLLQCYLLSTLILGRWLYTLCMFFLSLGLRFFDSELDLKNFVLL